jgi:hypothetical protein
MRREPGELACVVRGAAARCRAAVHCVMGWLRGRAGALACLPPESEPHRLTKPPGQLQRKPSGCARCLADCRVLWPGVGTLAPDCTCLSSAAARVGSLRRALRCCEL